MSLSEQDSVGGDNCHLPPSLASQDTCPRQAAMAALLDHLASQRGLSARKAIVSKMELIIRSISGTDNPFQQWNG